MLFSHSGWERDRRLCAEDKQTATSFAAHLSSSCLRQVLLYVYDLSNGFARLMSQSLLGKQVHCPRCTHLCLCARLG